MHFLDTGHKTIESRNNMYTQKCLVVPRTELVVEQVDTDVDKFLSSKMLKLHMRLWALTSRSVGVGGPVGTTLGRYASTVASVAWSGHCIKCMTGTGTRMTMNMPTVSGNLPVT
jgi:hypothetical protein